MALTKFVSAEWVTDPVMNTTSIKAIGDDDSVWWIGSVDSDVPPWPEFIEEHGIAAITGVPPTQHKEV